jgi:hypothetical protein
MNHQIFVQHKAARTGKAVLSEKVASSFQVI